MILINATLLTAALSFGGTLASTGANAALQPSQKATSGKPDNATDISASRRHHHHSHRRHVHGQQHYVTYPRTYQRSYYRQPAYSENYGYGDYGRYQPSYYGAGYYGSSFGGFGTSYSYGSGFGHGHHDFGHGGGHHGGYIGHGGGGHGDGGHDHR